MGRGGAFSCGLYGSVHASHQWSTLPFCFPQISKLNVSVQVTPHLFISVYPKGLSWFRSGSSCKTVFELNYGMQTRSLMFLIFSTFWLCFLRVSASPW